MSLPQLMTETHAIIEMTGATFAGIGMYDRDQFETKGNVKR
jgi:hypothetical protein